jgi:hypothetical protein
LSSGVCVLEGASELIDYWRWEMDIQVRVRPQSLDAA